MTTTTTYCLAILITLNLAFIAQLLIFIHIDVYHWQPSPPPLLPWFIFTPAVKLQSALHSYVQATTPPFYRVGDLATSYWKSEVLYALTIHGVFDAMDHDRKVTCPDIMDETGLSSDICKYIKVGVFLTLFEEEYNKDPDKVLYSLTSAGRLLLSNTENSMRDFVLMINQESRQAWRAGGTRSVVTKNSGWKEEYGLELFQYHQHHPEQEAQFDRAMLQTTPMAIQAVLGEWIPSTADGILCDIGGGLGTTAKLVLEQYPNLTAIVMDQSKVVERAKEKLEDNPRIKTVAGSFLDTFPSEMDKCDVFLLKYILHDWPDEECLTILQNIKQVAKPGSELVVVETVVGSSPSERIELSKHLMNINMFASCKYGARERTYQEFQSLMEKAGMGQFCETDGQCSDGYLHEIPTRHIISVLSMRL